MKPATAHVRRTTLAVAALLPVLALTSCGDQNAEAGATHDSAQGAPSDTHQNEKVELSAVPPGFATEPSWATTVGMAELLDVADGRAVVKEWKGDGEQISIAAYDVDDGSEQWRTDVPADWQDANLVPIIDAVALVMAGDTTVQLGADRLSTQVRMISLADGSLGDTITVPDTDDQGMERYGALQLGDSGLSDTSTYVYADGSTFDADESSDLWHLHTPSGEIWSGEDRFPGESPETHHYLGNSFTVQDLTATRGIVVNTARYGHVVQVVDTGSRRNVGGPVCPDGLYGLGGPGDVTLSPSGTWAAVGASVVRLEDATFACNARLGEIDGDIHVRGVDDDGTVWGQVSSSDSNGETEGEFFLLAPDGEPAALTGNDVQDGESATSVSANAAVFVNGGLIAVAADHLVFLPRVTG